MPNATANLARRSVLALAVAGWLLPLELRAAGASGRSGPGDAGDPGDSGNPGGRREPRGRIIISGAAGHLGELTVQALLARGVPASRLILVSRTPAPLARYAKLGASVRYGDFTQPDSLEKAFAGGSRMLLISIGLSAVPRPAAHKSAIDAALAHGVEHIAYTSFIGLSRGARTGIAADHYQTEQILRRSGARWTMLRNSIYMEELIAQVERMIATGRATAPAHEDGIGYVAREDCAAAAAAVLATAGHDDKIYDITGPELEGTRAIAAAASAVAGKPIQVVPAAGAPGPRRGFGGPTLSVTSNAVAELTGHPATTLREFLERHRAELLGAAPRRPAAAGSAR